MLQVVPEGLEIMKLLWVQHRYQNLFSISHLTEGSSSRFLFLRNNPEEDADGPKVALLP